MAAKRVVITGSTRGIGRGIAEAMLAQGARVAISARNGEQVAALVAELVQQYGTENVCGAACDIANIEQVQGLWNTVAEAFGGVDVWINNAGVSIARRPLDEADAEELSAIVNTNLLGVLYCNKVALAAMREQGSGQIWNMEGFGSNGQAQPGMTAYGATKRAVNYLNKAVRKDAAGSGVQVCTLSPGIVVTELLLGDYDLSSPEWEKAKRIFNILGDSVETVTPWLAEKVLASDKDGAKVAWLTGGKAFWRFMSAGFNKRDLFADIPGA